MRLLLIEDDPTLASYVLNGLREAGHVADHAATGPDGLFLSTSETYDAIILDRMLPQVDGMTILQTVRASERYTPVLILTARDSVADKVEGLRSGADDYLVKPFAFEELLARLELIVSRADTSRSEEAETSLTAGPLKLDLLRREVTLNGSPIDLKAQEIKLLDYLLRYKGHVVTRTMLIENVWDYHFDPQTNVIDVHISRLRTKLGPLGKDIIETVRGSGYRLKDGGGA